MTITMASLSTGSALHGSLKAGQWERSVAVQRFFGLFGEYHLQGRPHGRDLTTWCQPYGYANRSDLQDAIDLINTHQGDSGSVFVEIGNDQTAYDNCVFEGFEIDEEPWLDGSGINGWQVMGTLRWRQIYQ